MASALIRFRCTDSQNIGLWTRIGSWAATKRYSNVYIDAVASSSCTAKLFNMHRALLCVYVCVCGCGSDVLADEKFSVVVARLLRVFIATHAISLSSWSHRNPHMRTHASCVQRAKNEWACEGATTKEMHLLARHDVKGMGVSERRRRVDEMASECDIVIAFRTTPYRTATTPTIT